MGKLCNQQTVQLVRIIQVLGKSLELQQTIDITDALESSNLGRVTFDSNKKQDQHIHIKYVVGA